jgi:hypothetical protein
MRIIGRRQAPRICFAASATLIEAGACFNDQIHRLPSGGDSFVPKGGYRFATHAEANRHQLECLALGMASLARAHN